jgi:hypothetical protein
VLWYVKGGQRRRDLRAFISDVLRPRRDKSAHPWAQGNGGIEPLIENLAKPGGVIPRSVLRHGDMGRYRDEDGPSCDRLRYQAGWHNDDRGLRRR